MRLANNALIFKLATHTAKAFNYTLKEQKQTMDVETFLAGDQSQIYAFFVLYNISVCVCVCVCDVWLALSQGLKNVQLITE